MKKILLIMFIFISFICLLGCEVEKCSITFLIDSEEQIVEINKGTILNYNLISICEENEIEGFYYDENYNLKYDYKEINNDITIYVKTNRIEVTLVVIHQNIKIKVSKNKPIKIENILKYAQPYEIEGLYYDCRFSQPYNNENITEETTLFVDTNISLDNAKPVGEIFTTEYIYEGVICVEIIECITNLYHDGYITKEDLIAINDCSVKYHGGIQESDNDIWITEDLMIQLIYDKAYKYGYTGEEDIEELKKDLDVIIDNFYYLGTYNDCVVFRSWGRGGWFVGAEWTNFIVDDIYIRLYEGPGLYIWKPFLNN